MAKSHVAAWGPDPPTPAQLKEFFAQVESGQLTHSRLQGLLRGDDLKTSQPSTDIFRDIPVNHNDPRWRTLTGPYTYINSDLKLEHFPINGKGKAEVTFGYLEHDHEPITQEVLDDIERDSSIRRPDRAETESFLGAHPEEKDKYPIIGLCGSLVSLRGYRLVAYVRADESYRGLDFSGLDDRWSRRCRFLVVCMPYQLFVRWNKETGSGDAVQTLTTHDGYDTVQLMQGDRIISAETFCNNRDRLYGYCLGIVETMQRAGHSIEMPYCLQRGYNTTRED